MSKYLFEVNYTLEGMRGGGVLRQVQLINRTHNRPCVRDSCAA